MAKETSEEKKKNLRIDGILFVVIGCVFFPTLSIRLYFENDKFTINFYKFFIVISFILLIVGIIALTESKK